MTNQLSKAQIDAIRVELAKSKELDWIAERERSVRAASFKSQSAFWKTRQLKLLKIRRQISPEYEAFITRNN